MIEKMKTAIKSVLVSVILAAVASSAMAMSSGSAPPKFAIPFANSAPTSSTTPGGANYPLPQASQIGITNCAASLTDGMPPKTMQAVSAGGCAPFGQDLNGIFKQITLWNQRNQAGALLVWDSAFSSSVNGYPAGAMIAQAANKSCIWISQVENNVTNPDASGAGWTGSCPGGGISTTASGGSANAQTITATPFSVTIGSELCWMPGFSNTGALQVNVNGTGLVSVNQLEQGGGAALTAGEVNNGTMACAIWNGAAYLLINSATNASLVNADQPLSGGANVIPLNLGSFSGGATLNLDCGKRPLQFLANNGAFTIAASTNDGSCMVRITNGSTAGAVTFTGFTTNSNTGEPLDTTNGDIFFVTFARISSISTYLIKSLQ